MAKIKRYTVVIDISKPQDKHKWTEEDELPF